MAFDGRMLGGIGVMAAVVEAGSFVRAATALGLTQSGVSRAVARLEERVGVRLFQRSARAVNLTDEGHRFYAQVAPLLTGIEDAAGEAAGAGSEPRGRLRVNVDSLTARVLLGPHAGALLAAHPQLALELVVRAELGDLVADGFDAAVRFGEPEPSALIARRVLETRVLTFASRAYLARAGRPRHPRDLGRHECIQYRDPRTGRPFEWEFRRGGEVVAVPANGRLTVDDSAAKLAACLAGHGIAQLLELELRALPAPSPPLVRLFASWDDERYPLYVYLPSRQLPPAKVRALVDFLVAHAGEPAAADANQEPRGRRRPGRA
jgi:DNA-binding transcriptional LysR family regulator